MKRINEEILKEKLEENIAKHSEEMMGLKENNSKIIRDLELKLDESRLKIDQLQSENRREKEAFEVSFTKLIEDSKTKASLEQEYHRAELMRIQGDNELQWQLKSNNQDCRILKLKEELDMQYNEIRRAEIDVHSVE